jgi:hypothetical protein
MHTLEKGIALTVAAMVNDYAKWSSNNLGELTGHRKQMYEDFRDSFRVDVGRKLIKIVADGSVRAFIVKEDNSVKTQYGGYFKKGDILKPASWSQPAKNSARGNCVEGDFSWMRWTGPNYLA